jgi:hypothetical protein
LTSIGTLHRIGLPSPGGRHELAEICGHIASLPLDRSKPLWETWVIENVAGTDAHAGGRLAVMTKVHHAGVDGVTGANLMSQLCSTEPDAPAPDPVDGVGDASGLEIALSGAVYAASRLTVAKPVHNLVISNVPGPQVPLYYLGSEVKAMYPLGPIFHGSGLNITVMSLTGKLDVGIVSCSELLPDLWDMADDFEVALNELLDATR